MHKSFRLILLIILLLGNTVSYGQTDTTSGGADTTAQQTGEPVDQAKQEQMALEGQRLFSNNCASCHQLGGTLIGPDLVGVQDRKSEEWIIRFVQNSQAVIASGDPYAVELFEKYNKIPMPPMSLTDDEVRSVLAHIENEGEKLQASATAGDQTTAGGDGTVSGAPAGGGETGGLAGMTYSETLLALGFIALLLVAILFVLLRIRSRLANELWERDHPGQSKAERAPSPVIRYAKRLNPTFAVVGVIGVFVVIAAVGAYQQAQWFGSQQGYTPTQPIAFSHKLHAGLMQMDCQYCHTGAAKGKSANIPSVNICMNCHEYARQNSPIIKDLKAAYEEGKPIEWIRIHNLPDLAYFNHAQHVTVAGVECQTCHGEVQEMDKVGQFSTLEMGWCIDCHRKTEIDAENPYYQETFKFLDDHKNLTIAQMGGTECIKCHY